MGTVSDTRMTILQIVNEVRRKLGVKEVASLTSDSLAISLVDNLNDVIDEVSDFGDWKETLQEIVVTAQSSVASYTVNSTYSIKNIHEVAVSGQPSSCVLRTIDDLLRWRRSRSFGLPRNWAIMGFDSSTNSPVIEVYPIPVNPLKKFRVTVYEKVRQYTTADVSVIPVFPARMLVAGTHAQALFDESKNTQGIDYQRQRKDFEKMLSESYNRWNGDSGSDTTFTPAGVVRSRP